MDWLAIFAAVMLSQALAGPADERWPAVLAGFDEVRSQAFEDGRTDLLGHVYPAGSTLLRRDENLLASYVRRGIDIERLRMRLIDAEVVSTTDRHVVMHVTDQLVEARIGLPDGTVRDLPRDRPTRRVIELSLTPQGWRISAVRPR